MVTDDARNVRIDHISGHGLMISNGIGQGRTQLGWRSYGSLTAREIVAIGAMAGHRLDGNVVGDWAVDDIARLDRRVNLAVHADHFAAPPRLLQHSQPQTVS